MERDVHRVRDQLYIGNAVINTHSCQVQRLGRTRGEIAASSSGPSEYVRSGRKFKSEVYFGWFYARFVFLSEKSDWSGLVFGPVFG